MVFYTSIDQHNRTILVVVDPHRQVHAEQSSLRVVHISPLRENFQCDVAEEITLGRAIMRAIKSEYEQSYGGKK